MNIDLLQSFLNSANIFTYEIIEDNKAYPEIGLVYTPGFYLYSYNEELPTKESEIKGKIYCKKNTSSTAGDNQYNEYIYVKSTKKWEKVGEFQAEPDLSGYAKLTDIGTPENFTFTLEDGSTVTKSIRVISTTSQAGA